VPRVLLQDGRERARRREEEAQPRAPEPLGDAVLALQRSAGNSAVARMLSRRVLARMMTAPVSFAALGEGDLTPAKLRQMMATLDTAIAAMKQDSIQSSFADMDRVAGWRAQYETELAALLVEINKTGPADPEVVGLPWDKVKARGTPLAERIWATVIPIYNMRTHLNNAFEEHRQMLAAKQAEEETPAYEVPAEYKAKARARPGQTAKTEGAEDEIEEGGLTFPHKGKHAPPPGAVGRPTLLCQVTEEKGAAAIYKTRNPKTVIVWEQKARDEGWTLFDGTTVIHGFTDEEIGADHGEMTRFVRIDGDHGHPIIEDHQTLNTSFTAYMKKEVAQAKGKQDQDRLRRLYDYLVKINFQPHRVGLRTRPAETPTKELVKS
jgi:hypothetical protein